MAHGAAKRPHRSCPPYWDRPLVSDRSVLLRLPLPGSATCFFNLRRGSRAKPRDFFEASSHHGHDVLEIALSQLLVHRKPDDRRSSFVRRRESIRRARRVRYRPVRYRMYAVAPELLDQVVSLLERDRKHVWRGAFRQAVERRRYVLAQMVEQKAVVVPALRCCGLIRQAREQVERFRRGGVRGSPARRSCRRRARCRRACAMPRSQRRSPRCSISSRPMPRGARAACRNRVSKPGVFEAREYPSNAPLGQPYVLRRGEDRESPRSRPVCRRST